MVARPSRDDACAPRRPRDHEPADPPDTRRIDVIGAGLSWAARWSARLLLIVAAIAVTGFLAGQIWGIVLPTILALVLTTVLDTPTRLLHERLRFPRAVAALTTLVVALGVFIGVLATIAPSLAGQVGDIARGASSGLQQIQDFAQSNEIVSAGQLDTAVQAVQDRLQSSASSIASGVLVGVGAVSSGLLTLVLTLVLTFFFLKDGHRFLPWATTLSGPVAGTHIVEVLRRSWAALGGFIQAQALVGLADAVLIGAGLLILGVPAAFPLAILTFVGGFVPIIGALVVGAVAVLIALVANGLVGALIVLGLILVVQQVEGNVLQPILQGRTTHLHAGVVVLAVTLGSTLFGIIGAFLAVPAVAVAAVVLRYLFEIVDDLSSDREQSAAQAPGAGAGHSPDSADDDPTPGQEE